MVKMVIYDCDGVIFESKKANLEYYNFIFKHFGLPTVREDDEEKLKIIHTYANDDVLKTLIKDKDLSERAIEFSKTVDYSIFYKYMKFEKNFIEICKILKERNIKIGIATNRSKTFPHLFKYFKLDKFVDDYVTASMVENPKPYPDMLIYLLKKHNLTAKEAIYVGDSEVDYLASKKANIFFISYKLKINDSPVIFDHMEILNYI